MSSSSSPTRAAVDAAKSRLVYGDDDVLFGAIESIHGYHKSFGNVLDAGTGLHSLRWMATLLLSSLSSSSSSNGNREGEEGGGGRSNGDGGGSEPRRRMTRFTAITADTTMQRNVQEEATALGIDHLGQVIVGNWFPPSTSQSSSQSSTSSSATTLDTRTTPIAAAPAAGDDDDDETTSTTSTIPVATATTLTHGSTQSLEDYLDLEGYDTILADYLIGAMDGFSPYTQDQILPLLVRHLKPGGRLYVVGLQPIPDQVSGPSNIICRVRQIRDACILLAGHRCYREYPVEWVVRQIQNHDELHLVEDDGVGVQRFPILYRYATIVKQIQVARSKLKSFSSPKLADQMRWELNDLERQAQQACNDAPGGRLKLGFDYIVAAEKKMTTTTTKTTKKEAGEEECQDHQSNHELL